MAILSSRLLRAFFAAFMLYHCMVLASGRTIDEIIASSSTSVASYDFIGDIAGSVIRMELDMMLTLDQYFTLYGKQNISDSKNGKQTPRKKRKAISNLTKRWTNKEIPYIIDRSTFNTKDIIQIQKAFQEWEDNTCITFRRASSSDSNFVHFEDGSGCSSNIGMIGRKQTISLAVGCRSMGVIAHEIGHAVGFYHEQNRPDRDDYIIIKKENIIHPDLYNNFVKYSSSAVSTYDVPYDYKSIMHYGGTSFSKNGQYTILTIDPDFQEIIGNREGLSFNDIKLANLMYKCSERCVSTISCPKEGFMDKNCQCWCPGDPLTKCTEPKTRLSTQRPELKTLKPTLRPTVRPTLRPTVRPTLRPTSRPTTCMNMNSMCPSWATAGYCQTSYYVKTYCKSSCSTCRESTVPVRSCKDVRLSCKLWGNRGYCTGVFANFMSRNCPVTCNLCESTDTSKATSRTFVVERDVSERDGRDGSERDGSVHLMSSSLLTIITGILSAFVKKM